MKWAGKEAFNDAAIENFVLEDGSVAGEIQTAKVNGRLSFLRIYGAGHMVP